MTKRKTKTALSALLLFALLAGAIGCGGAASAPTADPHEGEVLVSDGLGGTMWAPLYEELELNAYAADCFSRDGGYISYSAPGVTALRGVDVSFYQGEIDWTAVAGDGVEFAIVRAGYRGGSEGVLYTDERFLENLEGAKAAGLLVGVYFFSQAVSAEEAVEEAEYVLSLLDGRELDLPVFFDWEHLSFEDGEARTDSVSGETLTSCCLAFCETIRAAGYDAGVYFYRSLGYLEYDLGALAGLTFWAACPGETPDFYYDFTVWQYSFEGAVAGIEASADLNLYFIKEATETEDTSPSPEA